MNLTIENILLVGSLLLLLSIVVAKRAYKYGVPTLLLFLGIGMLAGSDGIGKIHFDNPEIAQFIGIVALNFILFSGGLDTNWQKVKPVLKEGIVLSTLGVLLTALTVGFFVFYVTDFTIYESLLLGSIVSSTDAAAVFSILRANSLGLKKNLRPALELESGSNDPMAYVLTIAFLSLVMNPEQGFLSVIPMFIQQMALGALAGFAFGRLIKYIINSINLDYEGLYPVLVIALMFITFSATDFFGGNGFLAIYICAVYLSDQDLIHKKAILKMYDGLAWLMQIILFLTLGLLVFPSEVFSVMGVGLTISIFLILVARPLSVFLSLMFFKMKLRRRFYISWVGLRGAVPIVFATYPLLAGIDKASMIFNIVFFISVTSILIQGTTLSMVAKWLRVDMIEDPLALQPPDLQIVDSVRSELQVIKIGVNATAAGKKIVDLHFPDSTIVSMIERGDNYIIPTGSTIVMAQDILHIVSNDVEDMESIQNNLLKMV